MDQEDDDHSLGDYLQTGLEEQRIPKTLNFVSGLEDFKKNSQELINKIADNETKIRDAQNKLHKITGVSPGSSTTSEQHMKEVSELQGLLKTLKLEQEDTKEELINCIQKLESVRSVAMSANRKSTAALSEISQIQKDVEGKEAKVRELAEKQQKDIALLKRTMKKQQEDIAVLIKTVKQEQDLQKTLMKQSKECKNGLDELTKKVIPFLPHITRPTNELGNELIKVHLPRNRHSTTCHPPVSSPSHHKDLHADSKPYLPPAKGSVFSNQSSLPLDASVNLRLRHERIYKTRTNSFPLSTDKKLMHNLKV